MIKWAAVFGAMIAVDFVWSLYVQANAAQQRMTAAHLSIAIVLLSGFTTLEYVQDPVLLLPAAAGAWIGTFLAFRKKKG